MIASLRLQQFRSFKDASFEFEPGVNIIIGPNASGKTNLIEGILVAAQGTSYKGRDIDLIATDAPWARLDAVTFHNTSHTVIIERADTGAKKKFSIDDTEYRRMPTHHKIPVVIFEPNQLLLIGSSPELRRNLIDSLNEQLDQGFATTKRAYQRALAQRNALLKSNGARSKLFAWNLRLSELGGSVAQAREAVIAELNQQLGSSYSQLAGGNYDVTIKYKSPQSLKNYAASMLKKLEESTELDIARGFTGTGPHRDDIDITINGNSIQTFASRGEIRTTLLAIKIQEALLLEKKYNQKALMLLDDVFGELDGKRRKALTRFLQTHQAFITTTDADVVGKSFAQHAKQITISKD